MTLPTGEPRSAMSSPTTREPLRDAVELALSFFEIGAKEGDQEAGLFADAMRWALRPPLPTLDAARAAGEPGLDVERLATALASVEYQADPSHEDIRKARLVAGEYARLSPSSPSEPA